MPKGQTKLVFVAKNKIYFICVSNVQTMVDMFVYCNKFNQPLNNWSVNKVHNLGTECHRNVSNVQNMRHMFLDCKKLIYKPRWY